MKILFRLHNLWDPRTRIGPPSSLTPQWALGFASNLCYFFLPLLGRISRFFIATCGESDREQDTVHCTGKSVSRTHNSLHRNIHHYIKSQPVHLIRNETRSSPCLHNLKIINRRFYVRFLSLYRGREGDGISQRGWGPGADHAIMSS